MSTYFFQIDEMKASDLPKVRDLAEQLGYPAEVTDLARRFHALSKSQAHKLFVARNADHQVVGWVHVGKEMSSLLADDRADIEALVVDSQVRSQGIGASLLKTAEKWALDRNFKLMRIRSNVKRSEAHRFYLQQGYEIIKSWHLFTKSLKDIER